jgi:hypothetical protein
MVVTINIGNFACDIHSQYRARSAPSLTPVPETLSHPGTGRAASRAVKTMQPCSVAKLAFSFFPQQLRQHPHVGSDLYSAIGCTRSLACTSNRMATGSKARFSVFNGRSAFPAAMPIDASFFFEREAARLMSVRHRWLQRFRWWLFSQFPREDTAIDYERRHDGPESPKLHLLHGGVLRHSTPLTPPL